MAIVADCLGRVHFLEWVNACVGDDLPERLDCGLVAATFLPTLGVVPVVGRNFTVDEDRPGAEPVALLSFNLWKFRFAPDRGVIGKRISIDGTLTTTCRGCSVKELQ